MPLAKDGHPALELPTEPTKNVFTSFFNLISPDFIIEEALIACISPEKINLEPFLLAIDLINL